MKTSERHQVRPEGIDPKQLDDLHNYLHAEDHPALVSEQGLRTELPKPIFDILLHCVDLMRQGKSIALVPEDEVFTTQAAANFLGMSRQHLVTLLDQGQIPHHRVGTHRRIAYKDLIEFERIRRQGRRKSLQSLTKRLIAEGVYNGEEQKEDAG